MRRNVVLLRAAALELPRQRLTRSPSPASPLSAQVWTARQLRLIAVAAGSEPPITSIAVGHRQTQGDANLRFWPLPPSTPATEATKYIRPRRLRRASSGSHPVLHYRRRWDRAARRHRLQLGLPLFARQQFGAVRGVLAVQIGAQRTAGRSVCCTATQTDDIAILPRRSPMTGDMISTLPTIDFWYVLCYCAAAMISNVILLLLLLT